MSFPPRRLLAAALLGSTLFLHPRGASAGPTPPQPPNAMTSSEILLGVQRLNVLGRVLYVAAHPDDENTSLIAYWMNGALLDTAYLSVTRGDGGQNLIGPELREQLGVIRTHELMEARRLDHGKQFFTRAVDFGFSKNPEETLKFWDREKILADVVWVIRKYQPDLIATRFSPVDRQTHGHHVASAMLAQEAFAAAADPKRFPEQLTHVKVWQAKRVVWNTSSFFFSARSLPFDPTQYGSIEAGGFNPLLGRSYAEISAASRSMHKSQGFGVDARRGARKEYFQFLAGEPMKSDPLEGIDTTWSRVPSSGAVSAKVSELIASYRPAEPAASVPGLLALREQLGKLGDDAWVATKRSEVEALISACLGLHVEAYTKKLTVTPGQNMGVEVEFVSPSSVPVKLRSIRLPLSNETLSVEAALPVNTLVTKSLNTRIPDNAPSTQPYWLRLPGTIGTFNVPDQTLIGLPLNPPSVPVEVTLEVGGQEIRYALETRFKKVDPVEGEVRQDLVIAPPAFVNFSHPVLVFADPKPKTIEVRVTASTEAVKGQLTLEAPAGWKVEPASVPVALKGANAEAVATFTVQPPATPGEGTLRAVVTVDGHTFSQSRQRISYPHIGLQTLMPVAETKLVRADIQRKAQTIGYLPGAGDDIPESLQQIGYTVKVLTDADMNAAGLAPFDAVVVGIRAFNMQDRMATWQPELLAYTERGGVVIVQYNTSGDLKVENVGPFPLKVSRERVTDETAEVRILAPKHPAVTTPNLISPADFAGWVQERGLYFPSTWDGKWTAILSSNDPGEKPLDGGLLVARSGKGYFVYTGYAWFRQLPAGVPGAYRIFSNLVSLGKAADQPLP